MRINKKLVLAITVGILTFVLVYALTLDYSLSIILSGLVYLLSLPVIQKQVD